MLLGLQLLERRHSDRGVDRRRMVSLAALLEGIPEAVFLFEKQGVLVDCNQAAEQLCGQTRERLAGMSIVELNRLLSARDEYDQFVSVPSMGVNRALRGEVVREVRRVFRHPADNHVVETITSASPIRDAQGVISGALLIARDVTEIWQLNQRLADMRRHKEVGQMAAGLAHDFGNVLDTILQATELMEMTETAKLERSRYVELIRKAAANGGEIIRRVREYLRTGSGVSESVDLRQILRDVIALARPMWYQQSKLRIGIRLRPVPLIVGNASDLGRMFTNLVINAVEAMPDGGELTISCEPVGGSVRILVSDTGQGIPEELLKQVFMPYFTTKPQGTGLGLSGAQRIVNAHHGRIQMHSVAGKGTSLIVELPVRNASTAESTPESASEPENPGERAS